MIFVHVLFGWEKMVEKMGGKVSGKMGEKASESQVKDGWR